MSSQFGSRLRNPTRRGSGVAFMASVAMHTAVLVYVLATAADYALPNVQVYEVKLVAAPRPEPDQRKAPEMVERQAQETRPVDERTRQENVTEAPPQSEPDIERELAPRSTPEEEPLPGEEPSTGSDVATLTTSGVQFPFPEYLQNVVAQVYRRWQRPTGGERLRAEVLFFIRRDGSISNLQFVDRSGNFMFDIEAQGAIEAAANAGAFGPLPEGFAEDILPVSFFFDPASLGRRE
ncbi:MAG: TonB C-terminal domain-containing protein [Gemmatimonadota bacterium]|nr:TonB C-terminal domain-containing protein [Gemmatimonadota bacterium]